MGVDVVEGPPHLEEAREEMGRLRRGRKDAAVRAEELLELRPEAPVDRDAGGGGAAVADEVVEVRLVAVVEAVEDEDLVELRLVRTRAGAS